jgi:hypothetical protein
VRSHPLKLVEKVVLQSWPNVCETKGKLNNSKRPPFLVGMHQALCIMHKVYYPLISKHITVYLRLQFEKEHLSNTHKWYNIY